MGWPVCSAHILLTAGLNSLSQAAYPFGNDFKQKLTTLLSRAFINGMLLLSVFALGALL